MRVAVVGSNASVDTTESVVFSYSSCGGVYIVIGTVCGFENRKIIKTVKAVTQTFYGITYFTKLTVLKP